MNNILVSGLINIETTLKVDTFPLTYEPVRYPFFGIDCAVSGVGYVVAKALTILDDPVRFLSIIGNDLAGDLVRTALARDNIDDELIVIEMAQTPLSVTIYNREWKRQIHTDLKDIQAKKYPSELFDAALIDCSSVVLCNINYL